MSSQCHCFFSHKVTNHQENPPQLLFDFMGLAQVTVRVSDDWILWRYLYLLFDFMGLTHVTVRVSDDVISLEVLVLTIWLHERHVWLWESLMIEFSGGTCTYLTSWAWHMWLWESLMIEFSGGTCTYYLTSWAWHMWLRVSDDWILWRYLYLLFDSVRLTHVT